MADVDIAAIEGRLRGEFLDDCKDRIIAVSLILDHIVSGTADDVETVEFRRQITNIKGLSGSSGFPTISLIAHKLDDYLETTESLSAQDAVQIQQFIDAIEGILEVGADPSHQDTETLLRALPRAKTKQVSEQKIINVNALLIMPKGVWRRVVAAELMSCGFHISYAENGLTAINVAVPLPPDLIISAMELPDISGADLSKVFRSIAATAKANFAIVTTRDPDELRPQLSPGTQIINRGKDFAVGLAEALLAWRVA